VTLVAPRWDEARTALAAAARALTPIEKDLTSCDGLVLAADVVARTALPAFDTSAMDGWAVAGWGPWTVVGESLAGRPFPARLEPGSAVVIATGAVVPTGARAVIRSEDGHVEGRGLRAPDPAGPTHIRPVGEECAAGELLAGVGTLATPALVGLAAAAGHDRLTVFPRPRVALVLFGDELATAGIPGPGLVRDSLGPQLPAWLSRMGAEVVLVERAPDTLPAHVQAIRSAAAAADVVLTTGGTAAGPVDHLHSAIAQCGGDIRVDSVAVRPGHPMLAAALPDAWLVGLPGNPQSAIVTLLSLGAPILAVLAGSPALPDLEPVTLGADLPGPAREDRLVLGKVTQGVFKPGSHLGSAMLRGLADATGFAILPPGGAPAGATARWLPLPL